MNEVFKVSELDQRGDSEGRAEGVEAASAARDPVVAALCAPISPTDPCGADLDLAGDADYLNFLAQVEGILPTSFFSPEDGKPFDPSAIDLNGHLAGVDALLARSRDIRLLMIRARLLVLNRDIAGFAATVAAAAEWLDGFWDEVHPRPDGDDLAARRATVSALDLPTVIFPLQYTPLFEGRRTGPVTYRGWIVATGEIKARSGEVAVSPAVITEAIATADAAVLAAARARVSQLDGAIERIGRAFATHGGSAHLDHLPELVRKIRAFIDPYASSGDAAPDPGAGEDRLQQTTEAAASSAAPLMSIAQAKQALAAIADYYAEAEPSSPALPLVRQAHLLIGKSFLDIMTILLPTQVEKAAFQIGTDPVFDLPVSKLPSLSAPPAAVNDAMDAGAESAGAAAPANFAAPRQHVRSRAQALALLDSVQRYFRHSEPSSPVPMLCERARGLAERDFMAVLGAVLPKSALKALNTDR